MSKPVFDDLFKFEGRRNRKSYLLVQLALWAAITAGILLAAMGLMTFGQPGVLATTIGAVITLAGIVVFAGSVTAAWITSAQRCRDIGWPGWVCLAQLIPYVGFVAGLVIWIAPGETKETNKYGPSCI